MERESDVIQFKDLISFFNKEIEIIDFPSWDCLPYGHISPGKSIISKRFSSLVEHIIFISKPKIFLASSDSILQKLYPKTLAKIVSLNYQLVKTLLWKKSKIV